MKRIVHFTQTMSIPVRVEVPDDTHVDDVIAAAYDLAPGSLCVSCTGGGSGHEWSRDDAGDLIAVAVTDEAGAEIWTDTEHDDENGED